MSATTTVRELIPPAARAFGDRVHKVAADRWSAPTPCSQWFVQDVVNHVTSEHLWAPHLLRGETLAQVGDRYDGDVLGNDPVAAWDAALAASLAAFAAAGDDQPVHLSFGDISASAYAEQMLLDLVVHAWDVARGAGLEERLDPIAVEHVTAYAADFLDDWRNAGLFGAEVATASDDPQQRLLGLLGRRP